MYNKTVDIVQIFYKCGMLKKYDYHKVECDVKARGPKDLSNISEKQVS